MAEGTHNNTPKMITRETIQRLLRDVKQIIKQPLIDNGIYYMHDEQDMLKGYALIVGPEDTPYFGGFYFFEFHYPYDYPFSPPTVTFHTNNGVVRFNPNLYVNGKVCVSILNTWHGDKWSSCQTISSILITLCSLLNSTPFLNEPGITPQHIDYHKYNKIIEYSNIEYAICYQLLNVPDQFYAFYFFMKEHFYKNYDRLMNWIEHKMEEHKEVYVCKVSIYQMKIPISYDLLKQKMLNVKKCLEENTSIKTVENKIEI